MIRTWWAVAALLAVVAMHGATAHAAEPLASAPTTHTTHVGHEAPVDGTFGWERPAAEHGSDHHAMSVLGLCVAALATTALALLTLVRPGRRLLVELPRAVSVPTRAAGTTHGLAPPDLHALSVLRC